MPPPSFKYFDAPRVAELPGEEGARSYWELLAAKLGQQPDLLGAALETCERWLADGHSGKSRLEEWRALIVAAQTNPIGRGRIRQILLSGDSGDQRLREFNPFAGILTREERRRATELCGYRH